MSKRKNIIREDDTVKIINPSFVKRVGYPLSIKMVREQMTHEEISAVMDMFKKLNIPTEPTAFDNSNPSEGERVFDKIMNELARVRLGQKNWGGKVRSIHTKDIPKHSNKITNVISKRCVKTGIYHHGWGGQDYYGEYDYEPAYLEGEKTHVLLTLALYDDEGKFGDHLEIETTNVVKMVRADDGDWIESSSITKPDEHPSGLSGEHSVVLDAIHQVCLHGR